MFWSRQVELISRFGSTIVTYLTRLSNEIARTFTSLKILINSYDENSLGGQNVNKLNTKAEVRFHVLNADWMPDEVKQRLSEQQVNRINNMGELLVTSQEHRYQFISLYPFSTQKHFDFHLNLTLNMTSC